MITDKVIYILYNISFKYLSIKVIKYKVSTGWMGAGWVLALKAVSRIVYSNQKLSIGYMSLKD